MALRINLEIGHEASLRTKRTPEGFTHDWKIFVRGSDGADIHYYIEKVVFHLHETFQKPKRVVKEPPYTVKESGYAGFNLPIDIYLRNSGEPKKIKFNYDLHLQPSGPPISKVQKEKYIFNSVPEDFKQKLLRGGGVVTSSPQEPTESKSVLYEEKNQLISKPKFSGTDASQRKPKLEPQMSNSFQDLFGPPITKMTKTPESKVPSHKDNKSGIKPEKEKVSDKVKTKHSPHKEKDKERDRDKSEKKVKEDKKKDKEKRDKDRERNKEKSSKKEKSPKPRSPSPKHLSPKSSSPVPPPSTQSTPAGKHREKDSKGDKEKKEKLDKEEKKMKKEKKDKEQNKDKHRDSGKGDYKLKETKSKESVPFPKESEVQVQSPAPIQSSQIKQEKKDKPKIEDKLKVDKIEKPEDKKHKHKKKDKNKKERREKEEKSHKMSKNVEKEKTNTSPSFSSNMINSVNVNELAAEKMNLFGASPKMETSSVTSSPKGNEKSKPLNKLFSSFVNTESDSSRSSGAPSPQPEDNTRENSKQSEKSNERDSDQRKRKSSSDAEPSPEKVARDGESSNDSSDEEETVINEDEVVSNDDHSDEEEEEVEEEEEEEEEEVDEHMAALRNIQHKIMTMKDNDSLQKVVQLIAETGKYEISASTFDFDLCLLDMETIKQLEEYLSNMS